jgi:hypothetical protein
MKPHTCAMIALILPACAADTRGNDTVSVERTVTTPPGFHTESIALDDARTRIVMFGGLAVDTLDPNAYLAFDRTYEWTGEAWELVHTPTHPGRRSAAVMAYDAQREQMVLFGGLIEDSAATVNVFKPCPTCDYIRQLNDVWTYDGNTWRNVGTAPMAFDGSAIYDRKRQQILMTAFHGLASGDDGPKTIGLWAYQDDRFALLDSAGPRSAKTPRPAFDAGRGVLVLPILEGPDTGVWEWDEQWTRIEPATSPEPRRGQATTYDAARNRIMLFGGAYWDGQRYTIFNDLWEWDGQQWTSVHAGTDPAPSPREEAALIYEPQSNQLLLIGGLGAGQTLLREVWTFDAGVWKRLE